MLSPGTGGTHLTKCVLKDTFEIKSTSSKTLYPWYLVLHIITRNYLQRALYCPWGLGRQILLHDRSMMTSSNGNIFRVTDYLCGELPHQWRRALMFQFHSYMRDNCIYQGIVRVQLNWSIKNAWINNHMTSKVWDELLSHPRCNVEVYNIMDVIACPRRD